MNSSLSPRKAFTLVELLVTVAIIAVLASLLLPALSKAKTLAKDIQCRNRLKQTALASQMYVLDHERFTSGIGWEDQLIGYVLSEKRLRLPGCPHRYQYRIFECTGPNKYFEERIQLRYRHPDFVGSGVCQTGDVSLPRRLGFNSNGLGGGHFGGGIEVVEGGIRIDNTGERVGVFDGNSEFHIRSYGLENKKPSRVRNPGNCVQFGDTGRWMPGFNSSRISITFIRNDQKRHGDRSNMVFVDGHVESALQDSWFVATPNARRRWFADDQPHQELWPRPPTEL